jgi:hypothetical protein
MPEGSGLGGEYPEVAIVRTSVGTSAEAEGANQSRAQGTAKSAAKAKRRHTPPDDTCRTKL